MLKYNNYLLNPPLALCYFKYFSKKKPILFHPWHTPCLYAKPQSYRLQIVSFIHRPVFGTHTTTWRLIMKMLKKGQKGLTLIELLIVVAIIGILAAIAIPQFSAYRQKAFNAAAQSDLKTIKTSLEGYYTDNYYSPYSYCLILISL